MSAAQAGPAPAQVAPRRRAFFQVLGNTLLVAVINFTVWFGVTFWVYLETRSVFATGVIAGIFLAMTALSGLWFGSLVDRYRKKTMMLVSSAVSLGLYAAGLALYLVAGEEPFRDPTSVTLWALVLLVTIGVIVGNIRTIAMPTVVTLLIEPDRRDRANGLVGTASGISFLVTSVISGLLVGFGGMLYVLLLALGVTAAAIVHLALTGIPEDRVIGTAEAAGDPATEPVDPAAVRAGGADIATSTASAGAGTGVDIRGTLRLVAGVPGLFALLVFGMINNFLEGVFIALIDAYGLSLMSVEAWGLLWGVLSTGFIIGGLVIARWGLGKSPLRALLLANLAIWLASSVFTLHSSIVLLAAGCFVYMLVVPYIEAAEQTVLQRVVPYERQGRVFGLAQSMEQSAAPLTAFLISPLAQFVFIPFMTTGSGVDLIGDWFGTGPARGMALVFSLTGVVGVVITLIALRSRYYRLLAQRYAESGPEGPGPTTPDATPYATPDATPEPQAPATQR